VTINSAKLAALSPAANPTVRFDPYDKVRHFRGLLKYSLKPARSRFLFYFIERLRSHGDAANVGPPAIGCNRLG
jgi:hypothetical protein